MECVFIGTGAGNGVPIFYCDCAVCREARIDARCRRTRSSIALQGECGTIIIDAPPEISSQLLRENITTIDRLFLTHAHHDHSAGLGDIEIYASYHLKERLSAFMSYETHAEIEKVYTNLDDWLETTLLEPGQMVRFPGISLVPVRASHVPGTFGYVMDTCGFKTAYIPDTGPLPEETMKILYGVDVLVLDATFWGENWYPEKHLTVLDAIRSASELHVGKLYLTHLSMHYASPITCVDLERLLMPYHGKVNLAYDGLRFPLNRGNELSQALGIIVA